MQQMKLTAKQLQPETFKIIRMEEIFDDSQLFFKEFQKFLGVPLTIAQMHMLEYSIYSSHYWTSFDGNINRKTPHKWETQLSIEDVKIIENICHVEMAELGYTKISA